MYDSPPILRSLRILWKFCHMGESVQVYLMMITYLAQWWENYEESIQSTHELAHVMNILSYIWHHMLSRILGKYFHWGCYWYHEHPGWAAVPKKCFLDNNILIKLVPLEDSWCPELPAWVLELVLTLGLTPVPLMFWFILYPPWVINWCPKCGVELVFIKNLRLWLVPWMSLLSYTPPSGYFW